MKDSKVAASRPLDQVLSELVLSGLVSRNTQKHVLPAHEIMSPTAGKAFLIADRTLPPARQLRYLRVCVCVCVCVCVRERLRARVRACVRANVTDLEGADCWH